MTDRRPYNPDLPRHAADKVKRAMDDVLQLADTPSERLQIAVMAAAIPIGAASGFLAGMCKIEGNEVEQSEAVAAILEILKTAVTKGVSAVYAAHGESGTAKEKTK